MRPELRSKLAAVMRASFSQKPAVTPVTPVTPATGYKSTPLKLQGLQWLQVKNSNEQNAANWPVTEPVTTLGEPDPIDLEERKARTGV
jgi:hypothetical protein